MSDLPGLQHDARGDRLAPQPWMAAAETQRVVAALQARGSGVRFVGGCVRDALAGRPVKDVDLATPDAPDQVVLLLTAAAIKVVPTGLAHGTVTAVAGGRPFEITTLRHDVETDGRRAKVAFTDDWVADAARRDFTMNALSASPDGALFDPFGGIADLAAGRVRFVGAAEQRIREDFLRILRFFRFFAWYGEGRPDAEGLKACARLKDGLDLLSAERVWAELKKLLVAPDPSRALLWMRQASVLTRILPESEKWGIDQIHPLVKAEADLGWPVDPLFRLEAMVPPDVERMSALAERLKFSTAEAARLKAWAAGQPVAASTTESALARTLYAGSREAIVDRLRLALAIARGKAVSDDRAMMEAGGYSRQLAYALKWEKPVFPLRGADLSQRGFAPGPKLGAVLKALEAEWVASGFVLQREALLRRAAAMKEES